MQPAKQKIYNLIDAMPESELSEIVNFIMFVKVRDEINLRTDLEGASMSSTDFWDNEVDDEVWNNEFNCKSFKIKSKG